MSARAEVLAAARAMAIRGLVAGTSGNVSMRDGERVVITPTGLAYDEMKEDDLVVLGLDGTLLEGEREPSSERRVHLAVYAARADAGALVHTHSVHATAWSHLGEPLDTGNEELEQGAGGPVNTARFEATGTDALADVAVAALGERRAVLLERHGVLGLGESPAQALEVCAVVERQAQIAWLLRGVGR